jgi:hypothetical protein
MTVERWKFAFTTRRVAHEEIAVVAGGDRAPRPGDLVLAEVVSVGQTSRMELTTGRRATLFRGDLIVLAYGERRTADELEAVVPGDLGGCELVSAGGVAARIVSSSRGSSPTRLQPLGLLYDAAGRRVNVRDYALGVTPAGGPRPRAIAVIATTANAGKGIAASHLARAFRLDGLRVGAAKLTGTAAGADTWRLQDAGADPVLDFTDAGQPGTSGLELDRLLEITACLSGHLAAAGVDVALYEAADGVFQRETGALVGSPEFAESVDAVVLTSIEAAAATAGVAWLRERGLPVVAVSGPVASAPLAAREAAAATGLPVVPYTRLAEHVASAVLPIAQTRA